MKTWVRKTLSAGILAAGALLLAPSAANADTFSDNTINAPVNVSGNGLAFLGEATGLSAQNFIESGKVTESASVAGTAQGGGGGHGGSGHGGGGHGGGRGHGGNHGHGGGHGHFGGHGPRHFGGGGFLSGNHISAPLNFCGNSLGLLGSSAFGGCGITTIGIIGSAPMGGGFDDGFGDDGLGDFDDDDFGGLPGGGGNVDDITPPKVHKPKPQGYGNTKPATAPVTADDGYGDAKPVKVKPAKVKPAKVKPAKVKPAKVKPAKVAPYGSDVEPVSLGSDSAAPADTDVSASR